MAEEILFKIENWISVLLFPWSGWNNFKSDLAENLQKTLKFPPFFKVFFILPPVWLLNLGSDLSINNIVRLGLADTKIDTQDAVKKVLEPMEKWKYASLRGKF